MPTDPLRTAGGEESGPRRNTNADGLFDIVQRLTALETNWSVVTRFLEKDVAENRAELTDLRIRHEQDLNNMGTRLRDESNRMGARLGDEAKQLEIRVDGKISEQGKGLDERIKKLEKMSIAAEAIGALILASGVIAWALGHLHWVK